MALKTWLRAFLSIKKENMAGRLSINELVTCSSFHCSIFLPGHCFMTFYFNSICQRTCLMHLWWLRLTGMRHFSHSIFLCHSVPHLLSSLSKLSKKGKTCSRFTHPLHLSLFCPWNLQLALCGLVHTLFCKHGTPEMQSDLPGSSNLYFGSSEDTKSC